MGRFSDQTNFVAFTLGGDGGEAVEGRFHCERWGVSQLRHTREPRLPGCNQEGVSWHFPCVLENTLRSALKRKLWNYQHNSSTYVTKNTWFMYILSFREFNSSKTKHETYLSLNPSCVFTYRMSFQYHKITINKYTYEHELIFSLSLIWHDAVSGEATSS